MNNPNSLVDPDGLATLTACVDDSCTVEQVLPDDGGGGGGGPSGGDGAGGGGGGGGSGSSSSNTNNAKCPGSIANAVNTALVMGALGPLSGGAQALAAATGHVVTIGFDANFTLSFGTFGGSIHAGDSLAFDPQGNIAFISTTGTGGGFGGDTGFTGQLGYLQATSVLTLENGSTPTLNIAGGDGPQVGVGTDLEGNVNLNLGGGGGLATSSTVDVSHVTVLACGPG